jgi:hypothetical protein
MRCLRQSLVVLSLFTLSGCEIIASFDRDKIPAPAFMTPEAGPFTPAPPERDGGRLMMDAGFDAGMDAGVRDAGRGDASLDDAGLGDASLGDAASGDGGPG